MKAIVISDLDGTLFDSDTQLSQFTVNAINFAVKNGVSFTYATARSLNSAMTLTRGLTLKYPVITYNGACIKHPETGEIIEIQGLDDDQVDLIREGLRHFGVSPLVYTFLDGEEKVLWQRGSESLGMLHYLESRAEDDRMLPVDCFEDLFCGEIFYVTCIEDHRERLAMLNDELRCSDSLRCVLQQELNRPEYWLEIMDYRVSKAHAVDDLKKLMNIDRVVSFGDSINDVPLFEVSDECYAVANAVDALKVVADDVIESNDEDGVARWLLENYKRLI
ncbi:MAG: HAD hydrolase family protein [Clostridia bacterium]|nr:HAD hydrolase family protein [Clostridia bacterium]